MGGWLYLAVAIVLEVCGTTAMKMTDGFTRPVPTVAMAGFYVFSFIALTFAIREIDVSVGYAVWSGVGTALIAVVGIAMFKESAAPLKLISIGLIIAGVAGLKIASGGP
ncbi:MAG: multidrug efflux SMR transporter [Planctomycetales bacterium]|nr:multidrug efflux SMR transporter [Planctomycetales bacterium]